MAASEFVSSYTNKSHVVSTTCMHDNVYTLFVTEEDAELSASVPYAVTVPTCVAKKPALVGVLVCDESDLITDKI